MSLRKIMLSCCALAISCVLFTGCPKPGQDASKETKKSAPKPMVTSGKSAAAKKDAPAPEKKADAPKADAPKADAPKAETKK